MHSHHREFNGMTGREGLETDYLVTTSYGVNLLMFLPFGGDTRLSSTVDAFSAEAAAIGGEQIAITDSGNDLYWFLLFPLTVIFTPSVTTVKGDVQGTALLTPQEREALEAEAEELDGAELEGEEPEDGEQGDAESDDDPGSAVEPTAAGEPVSAADGR
jgi:hypothetical protein